MCQWLQPKACSKEHVPELFLNVLTGNVNPWMLVHCPKSRKKVASLGQDLSKALEEPGEESIPYRKWGRDQPWME